MTYEAAPATALLATHCCVCNRPLLDATSVELGIGPICRRKAEFVTAELPEEARVEANRLVHGIAARGACAQSIADVAALFELGFEKLAEILEAKLVTVRIEADDSGMLLVSTPYDADFVADVRAIPGRRWDKEAKTWAVPGSQRAPLWAALRRHYAGALATGPKGSFEVAS